MKRNRTSFPPDHITHKVSKDGGLSCWGNYDVRMLIAMLSAAACDQMGFNPHKTCRVLNAIFCIGSGVNGKVNDPRILKPSIRTCRLYIRDIIMSKVFHSANPDVNQRHFLESHYHAWKLQKKLKG